jgi:hypothetical protein
MFGYTITRFGVWRRKRSPEVSNENNARRPLNSILFSPLSEILPTKYLAQAALMHQAPTAKDHESTSKHFQFDIDEDEKHQDKGQPAKVKHTICNKTLDF